MADIDAVVKAATAPRQIEMVQKQGAIHVSGRPFMVAVPIDLTESEALALCGYLARLPAELAAERGPRILVPRPLS